MYPSVIVHANTIQLQTSPRRGFMNRFRSPKHSSRSSSEHALDVNATLERSNAAATVIELLLKDWEKIVRCITVFRASSRSSSSSSPAASRRGASYGKHHPTLTPIESPNVASTRRLQPRHALPRVVVSDEDESTREAAQSHDEPLGVPATHYRPGFALASGVTESTKLVHSLSEPSWRSVRPEVKIISPHASDPVWWEEPAKKHSHIRSHHSRHAKRAHSKPTIAATNLSLSQQQSDHSRQLGWTTDRLLMGSSPGPTVRNSPSPQESDNNGMNRGGDCGEFANPSSLLPHENPDYQRDVSYWLSASQSGTVAPTSQKEVDITTSGDFCYAGSANPKHPPVVSPRWLTCLAPTGLPTHERDLISHSAPEPLRVAISRDPHGDQATQPTPCDLASLQGISAPTYYSSPLRASNYALTSIAHQSSLKTIASRASLKPLRSIGRETYNYDDDHSNQSSRVAQVRQPIPQDRSSALENEPPIARHINFRAMGESSRPRSVGQLDPFYTVADGTDVQKGNVGTLYDQIRRLKIELDSRNEMILQLEQELGAIRHAKDTATLSEKLRESERELRIWRHRAQQAEMALLRRSRNRTTSTEASG